jgi:hypothetical protein
VPQTPLVLFDTRTHRAHDELVRGHASYFARHGQRGHPHE